MMGKGIGYWLLSVVSRVGMLFTEQLSLFSVCKIVLCAMVKIPQYLPLPSPLPLRSDWQKKCDALVLSHAPCHSM